MPFLTVSHEQPPRHVVHQDRLVPTEPLIAANDIARLAELGIYPHDTEPGDAPLGYTDWLLTGDRYTRRPAGSVAEIQDAMRKLCVPTIVTMRQARLALLQAGLLSQVEAAIAAIEDPVQRQAVQIEWEYATEVDVTHPWVQALTTALGLSEAQLDALFTLAATL